jgi:uncharacterized phiE125 gp8 family phage protein
VKKIVKQTYRLKTAPITEPLVLSELKIHLRLDAACTDEDVYLSSLITVARQMVEKYTSTLLGSQVWELSMDAADYSFEINKLPVISIDEYKYIDENNVSKDMSAFTTVYEDLKSYPARIRTEDVPSIYDFGFNQISLEFTAGLVIIPDALKQAMLLIIGHLYENRQDVVTGTQVNKVPETSQYLMAPYVYNEFR